LGGTINNTKMNIHCIKTVHLIIIGKHKRLYINSQKNWYGFDANAGINLSFLAGSLFDRAIS